MEKTFCIFGDSIGCGYYDWENRGWVSRFDEYINSKDWGNDVYNLSINGDDIHDLTRRFKIEIEERNPDVILIAEGLNNAQIDTKKNVSEEVFKEDLSYLFQEAKKITKDIIFIGATKADESKTNPVPWHPEKQICYKNSEIEKYDDLVRDFCGKNDLLFISMFDLLENEDLEDGLHPNSQGHEKMFERIKEFLIENKIIEKV